jgi:pyruvate kinase
MVDHPFPTRAEISDIYSAVIDGADGLLLNAETSVGKYPIDALITMNNVCEAAENHFPYSEFFHDMISNEEHIKHDVEAVANSIVKSAFNLKCPVIICETDVGRLPRYISKYHPFS